MKHIKLFEQFIKGSTSLNESTINSFVPNTLDKKNEVNHKNFAKLMPKTAGTSDSATSHIWSYEGNTMFVHYQYFVVKPNGNKPDRKTYRIHQCQYWLNDTQLKWQNRAGENVNVTMLTIYDVTEPSNEINLGQVYVDTDVFLKECKVVFEMLNQRS